MRGRNQGRKERRNSAKSKWQVREKVTVKREREGMNFLPFVS
jgi:hypothetical protein